MQKKKKKIRIKQQILRLKKNNCEDRYDKMIARVIIEHKPRDKSFFFVSFFSFLI